MIKEKINIAEISHDEMETVNMKKLENIMFYLKGQQVTRAEIQTLINNMDFSEPLVNYDFGSVTSPEIDAERRAAARDALGLPDEK